LIKKAEKVANGNSDLADSYSLLTKAELESLKAQTLLEIKNIEDKIANLSTEAAQVRDTAGAYRELATSVAQVEYTKATMDLLNTLEAEENKLDIINDLLNNKNTENSNDISVDNSTTTPLETVDDFDARTNVVSKQSIMWRDLNEVMEKQIDLAEAMFDDQAKYQAQNDLLYGQIQLIKSLEEENGNLNQLYEDLVKEAGYSIEEVKTWFDINGNKTMAYYDALNKYTGQTSDTAKEARDAIEDLASKQE